jgi:hypothetical protein
MKNIAENLAAAMEKTSPDDKFSVIVTTTGDAPKGFALTSFEGLDGLYHGKLSHADIQKLSQHANVKAVELDGENTVM